MISNLSRVSPQAELGANVSVGDFTVIHDNVQVADGATIGSHCVIGLPTRLAGGRPLVLGPGALIRSHSTLYEGSTFGPRLETGHGVVLREKIDAGINFRVGTHCDLQGDQCYGNYCRLHSDVHIGKGFRAGHFLWIFPRAITTNDPMPPSHLLVETAVDDMVVICTNVLMLPGIRIGLGGFVAAGSIVKHDVPPVTCVAGNPAEPICLLHQMVNMEHKIRSPWPLHFRDAYPAEAQPALDEVLLRVQTAITAARQAKRSQSTGS